MSTIELNQFDQFDSLIGQVTDVNDENVGDDNQTLLMLAAHYGATDIGQALISEIPRLNGHLVQ